MRSFESPDVVKLDGPFEHEFIHTRGLRLHAAVSGISAERPLILLLHDAYGGWFDYAKVIPLLADAGYGVAAIDMRGYGMSDKPPIQSGFSARTLVSDIAGVIPALGAQQAIVIGADSGGTIGWLLATSYPERIQALVSISAAHPVDLRRAVFARPWDFVYLLTRLALNMRPMPLRTRRRGICRAISGFLHRNTTAEFHRLPEYEDNLQLRYKAASIPSTAPAMAHFSRTILAPVPFGHLRRVVTCPTLLLHAPQRVWSQVSRRSRKRVASEYPFQADTVGASKNLPHLENPAAFVAKVTQFLDATIGSHSTL